MQNILSKLEPDQSTEVALLTNSTILVIKETEQEISPASTTAPNLFASILVIFFPDHIIITLVVDEGISQFWSKSVVLVNLALRWTNLPLQNLFRI